MTFQYYFTRLTCHTLSHGTSLQADVSHFLWCMRIREQRKANILNFLMAWGTKDIISRRHHWFPVAKCCLLLSYRFSVLWNSVILRFCAPIHSSWFSDPSKLGSSKGLESPRKKCNKGIANSHSPSALHEFAMISLQRSWIPSTALLKVHERQKNRI